MSAIKDPRGCIGSRRTRKPSLSLRTRYSRARSQGSGNPSLSMMSGGSHRSDGSGHGRRRSLRSHGALESLGPLRSDRPLLPPDALEALQSLETCRSGRALLSLHTLYTRDSLEPLETRGSCRSLHTLQSLYTLGPDTAHYTTEVSLLPHS
jgi:hypothetical protein